MNKHIQPKRLPTPKERSDLEDILGGVKYQVLAGVAPEVDLEGYDRNILIQIAVVAIDAILRKKI